MNERLITKRSSCKMRFIQTRAWTSDLKATGKIVFRLIPSYFVPIIPSYLPVKFASISTANSVSTPSFNHIYSYIASLPSSPPSHSSARSEKTFKQKESVASSSRSCEARDSHSARRRDTKAFSEPANTSGALWKMEGARITELDALTKITFGWHASNLLWSVGKKLVRDDCSRLSAKNQT